ncbi:hypothetical protein FNV43_RR08296 [Rhamnella rubrinervis]|uniref:Uncharacterized protein n=1 Tax=Rhamnella rubrinervis TaxID=2594499 RepID=A0A8K0MNI5_9ROSA|nr:hypothetical protein FNV43_RR08296 [Rhamnella rubrinervis]
MRRFGSKIFARRPKRRSALEGLRSSPQRESRGDGRLASQAHREADYSRPGDGGSGVNIQPKASWGSALSIVAITVQATYGWRTTYGLLSQKKKKGCGATQTLSKTRARATHSILSEVRELRSELSQCVKIDRPGSFFYVEVGASLSMIKSLGGVEAGLFMLVILEL